VRPDGEAGKSIQWIDLRVERRELRRAAGVTQNSNGLEGFGPSV